MNASVNVEFKGIERLKRNLDLLSKNTSKTVQEMIDFKLYDAGRGALKGTGKADTKDIRATLNAQSDKNPKMTVKEMIVIKQHRLAGDTDYDLKDDVKKLLNSRLKSVGFAKAGWLPGIKKQAMKVNRFFKSKAKVKDFFGGSKSAVINGQVIEGSIWNDVEGSPPSSVIQQFKEIGADAGIEYVNRDIEKYLSKKLDIPIERFNNL